MESAPACIHPDRKWRRPLPILWEYFSFEVLTEFQSMTQDNQRPSWVVLKFGGSSVSSLDDWNNIAQIIKDNLQQGVKVAVVHSAFKNVTNQLEKQAQQAANGEHEELCAE